MPNWCYTKIVFKGKPDVVKALYDFVSDDEANNALKISTDFGVRWLGCYLERAGYDWESYRCRGTLEHISDLTDNEFFIETETAWVPMLSMWQAIIDKIAPGIETIYNAEEPGCEIFWTNDPEIYGSYWVDVYDADHLQSNVKNVFGESNDYTESDLRKALLEIFPDEKTLSMEELICKLNNEYDVNEGMAIHEWFYVPVDELD